MKQSSIVKTAAGISGLLLLSFASSSCRSPGAGTAADATNPAVAPIQQTPAGLLCGIKRAVCYSGFRTGQRPGGANPSDGEILEDLQIISRQADWGLIRLYDARENSEAALRLIEANHLKLKVLLGAWLAAEVSNTNCPWHRQPTPEAELQANRRANAGEIERAIRLANQYPNIVVAVAVGNECLVDWSGQMVTVDSIVGYVRKVKQSVNQPVTVADNYEWWAAHGKDLAKELDFVSVHTYAEWDGKDIDEALPYTIANLQAVRNALPNSRLAITETGWATVSSEFGARASEEKQKRYYHDLFAWTGKMNITTFFFEAFDEDWKGNPNDPLGAEKHWGLFTVDRKPKLAMQQ
jgi:exo-beta-1,3-glucanase (GH17 family)